MYRVAFKRACSLHLWSVGGSIQLSSANPHASHGNTHCYGCGTRLQGHTVTRGYSKGAEEPFLSGSSGSYIESMYESWQADRSSVHKVKLLYK